MSYDDGGKPDFECFVPGIPRPQGSKSQARNGHMYEASKHVKAWRKDVAAYASSEWAYSRSPKRPPLAGPLVLGVEFVFQRPNDHFRRRACGNVHADLGKRYLETCPNCTLVLRDDAPIYVTCRPDLDKCVRAVKDAGKTAGLYGDDSQVVGFAGFPLTCKRYAHPGEQPGARIRIWRVA